MVISGGFTSYSVDADKKFAAGLRRAANVVTDLRIPFGLILADFYRSEAAIFKLTGPGQYPPLSLGYQKQKLKKYGFDYPLLFRTGALAASVLGPSNPGSVAEIGRMQMTFGTSIAYGIYHQSDEARSKIPLRKFLFIGPESTFANSDQQGRVGRWLNILNDFVLKGMRAQGLS